MFEILETERILDGQSQLTFLPKGHELLSQMLASSQKTGAEGQRTGRTDGRHRKGPRHCKLWNYLAPYLQI